MYECDKGHETVGFNADVCPVCSLYIVAENREKTIRKMLGNAFDQLTSEVKVLISGKFSDDLVPAKEENKKGDKIAEIVNRRLKNI